jgi:hypothetical protein
MRTSKLRTLRRPPLAEGYAVDAIDFAQAAIYEAESVVLDAVSARAAAKVMSAS